MASINNSILRDAEILWDYHHISDGAAGPEKDGRPDCFEEKGAEGLPYLKGDGPFDRIIAFGSHDLRVARRAAALYLEGAAPEILFTGGFGRITRKIWEKPEAAVFREEAVRAGVPSSSIRVESAASNTGENIRFARRLAGSPAGFALVVDKPARERRTRAALRKQWPELDFRITSPPGSFLDTLRYYEEGAGGTGLGAEDFIGVMLGDLRRMTDYAARGFQTPEPVPDPVRAAARRLLRAGILEK